MRRLTLLFLLLPALVAAETFRDDFGRYRPDSDPTPDWQVDGDLTTVDHGLAVRDGYATWRAVPFAAAGSCAVEVRASAPPAGRGEWLTAGLALYYDARNYWALNLVISPEKDGRRHFGELHECLEGTWLAQNATGTKLTAIAPNRNAIDWREGTVYRLELRWTAEQLTGTISAAGQEVARYGYRFDPGVKAVATGRPALRVNDLDCVFAQASAEVLQGASEPERARPPAWQSRPGQALAPGTGYFATARVGERWWLLDPEGKPFFDVGTDHITYQGHPCEKLGYPPFSRVTAAKYGNEEAWAKVATDRLKSWNFNTVAAGHAPSTRHRGLSHVLFASFGSGFARREWLCEPIHWTGFPNVFSPAWPRYCRAVARRLAEECRDDPWCLGVFLDNELEWFGKTGHLVDEVFRRGADHSAKRALATWLVQRFGSWAGVDAALGSHYGGEAGFLAATDLPPDAGGLALVRSEFLKEIAQRYFQVPCEAWRAVDSQHLLWGCRFAGQAPVEVLPTAGRYNDVFTINTYPWVDLERGQVLDTPRLLAEYYALAGKPMVITEWSFPALDAGLPCKGGAGMRVDTQAQKARCYEIFANAMADLPFMVGYHYFMYLDEPAEAISSTFPEDSNYGLINVKDEPYPELTAMATRVNAQVYARHAASRPPVAAPVLRGLGAHERPALRNGGPTALERAHIVLDLPVPLAEVVPRVEPGETVVRHEPTDNAQSVWMVSADHAGARFTCERRSGALFDLVSAGGRELGRITVAAHQREGGRQYWSEATKVESLTLRVQGGAKLVDAVLALPAPAGGAGAPGFRVGVRAVLFEDLPVVLVRPLWYESTDARTWTLERAFVFCRPRFGGHDGAGEVGGPAVPMYYARVGVWTDPAHGGAFGAASPGEPWQVSFWKDNGTHPDASLAVGATLAKGQRCELPQVPYLWCFATADATAWRRWSSLCQETGRLTLVPAP